MTNTGNETQRDAWNGVSGPRWVADPDKRDDAMIDVDAFDRIADATGLESRWIIPAGTGHGGAVR